MSVGTSVTAVPAIGGDPWRLGVHPIAGECMARQTEQASPAWMQVRRRLFFWLIRCPEKAAQDLGHAINMAADASGEGLDARKELCCQAADQGDLEESFIAAARELTRREETSAHLVRFRVIVEGQRRRLNSSVQDEVYQIGRELLFNAFRHAQARQVEAEIRYGRRLFSAHLRDDGQGIGPEVLETGGLGGHRGLREVRERANRIGASLDFWSKRGAGTEVRLTVPSSIAYWKPSSVARVGGRRA